MTKLNKAVIHQIITRYKNGENMIALGRVFGCSQAAISNTLRKAQIQCRPRGTPKYSRAEWYFIICEYRNIKNTRLIADKYGVTTQTVRNWNREFVMEEVNMQKNLHADAQNATKLFTSENQKA